MARAQQSFYEQLYPKLWANPWWMGVSDGKPQGKLDFIEPEAAPAPVGEGAKPRGWVEGLKASLVAVRESLPFVNQGSSEVSKAVAKATGEMGGAGSAFVRAAADSVSAAQGGIRSGFRIAVILGFGLIFLWGLSVLGPFLPKGQGSSA